eukprot:10517288-Heterocapsa_arctica.AAC.1
MVLTRRGPGSERFAGASLVAISKVPDAGWVQILAGMACCVTSQDQSPGTAAAKVDSVFMVLILRGRKAVQAKRASKISNSHLAKSM